MSQATYSSLSRKIQAIVTPCMRDGFP